MDINNGNRKFNLAIIGCGRISYKHIKAAIDNQDKVNLVAVCDVSKEKAVLQAGKYYEESKHISTPKIFTDYKEMLKEHKEIDIVAICTESGYHAGMAIACMNEGKHVIVEKPMALSTGDADIMIGASRRNNVKLCVSHQNRFNPTVQKLRNALNEGRFGRIIAGNARVL